MNKLSEVWVLKQKTNDGETRYVCWEILTTVDGCGRDVALETFKRIENDENTKFYLTTFIIKEDAEKFAKIFPDLKNITPSLLSVNTIEILNEINEWGK